MENNWQQNENEIENEPVDKYEIENKVYRIDDELTNNSENNSEINSQNSSLTLLKPQNGVRKSSMNPNRIYKAPQNNEREMSLPLEIGKSIRLLRNGDPFYRGHKFVISTRRYRFFDAFMDDISYTLNFGAIRKIYTIEGQRLLSLDDLKDGEIYVAAGIEKFIRMNYIEISEGKRQPPMRLPSLQRDLPDLKVSQYEPNQSLIINVFKNGDTLTTASKILLYKNSTVSFEAVLNEISDKVKLLNGPILKLYKMDGELVFMPHKLENGQSYVAAGRERFKNVEYNLNNEHVKNSLTKSVSRDLPPVKVQQNQKHKLQLQNSIKKNQKTKVNFDKPQTDSIFKLSNNSSSNEADFNDHNGVNESQGFNDNSQKIGSETQRLDYTDYNNGNKTQRLDFNDQNNGSETQRLNYNHNHINSINNDYNKVPGETFREIEDKELHQSYQKLSDDDFSELNSHSLVSEKQQVF